MTMEPELAVLGLGNILRSDDGIGVRLVDELARNADRYPNVKFIDGGTGGLRLLNRFDEFPAFLALDAAEMKLLPASHRWITPRDVTPSSQASFSLHDVDFAQTLTYAEQFFFRPATAILAIQPQTLQPSDKLSPLLEAALPHLINEVRQALDDWSARGEEFRQALEQTDPDRRDLLFLTCLRPQRGTP